MGKKEFKHDSRAEIGKLAVWSVTSAKPGNGVEMLRDDNLETYWQSDGGQPHLINIQFQKKVRLKELEIYADFKQDESYTPNKLSIRAGNSFHDLREIRVVDLEEPVGWMSFPLTPDGSNQEYMRAYFVQLAVLSNHQNGRDTHIRQVKIYGPHVDLARAMGHPLQYTSPEFQMFSCVR
uniref:Anaphase-promoting complex subunit 10 n=1 Tax=Pyramimonas obovata TaxID=1411642 RepID=A0A7S0RL68_9CHLO|mmetsp:Transcript_36264/g.79124  ORF Transcript_36264/g.79124 Transcript_36264/m.79124 type:complete len:179 (+) Transcript_36264:271-807(+)|eukprot:CAMPEP_0118936058 /NCGR_PEP_ID=MMETSP1169-20130426/15984_1 /TAXON_ID=36882 /ORGANISM="Pyramimonas obovata, Strain CCMP722" /LENGTH=178 /DNA_ID=CAMNT_0006879161 /DNA_START=273 /DNA_END=809 /DNA_ORIENTATION=-